MKWKNARLLWTISRLVVGITTMFLVGTKIMGVELPDPVIRVLGMLDLTAIAVLGFSMAVRFFRKE